MLIDADQIESLSLLVGETLLSKGLVMTTAESCTGGGIGHAITSIPGSSQWFEQGFITYSNRAKQQQLSVSKQLLVTYGAVSSEVAEAMAIGALSQARADIAVAVTGIAGPDGGSLEKPVGTVWIAWATKQSCKSQLFLFEGDRQSVRLQTIAEALSGLKDKLEKNTV